MKAATYFENIWLKFTALSPLRKAFIMCALSALVIILRRPELILHPQFWAEDFAVFYKQAYVQGLASFGHSYSDLLQTFPRLMAFIVVRFPFAEGPLLFNLIAIAAMTVPVFVLWSDKTLLKQEGDLRKLILTILFILIPNVTEIFGNLTNSVWYLAVAALLALVRTDPVSAKKWLVFDSVLLLLVGLTGPYSTVLLLIALFLLAYRRNRFAATYIKTVIILCCALLQLLVYSHNPSQTPSLISQAKPIVKNYNRPIEITGMRYFVMPVLGREIVTDQTIATSPQTYALGMVFIVLMLIAFLKSRLEIRAIILFCALLYAVSFIRAQTVPVVDFWRMLQFNAFGDRYFFVPFFGWLVALLALTNRQNTHTAKIAAAILALYIVCFPFSFGVPALKDFHFSAQVKAFNALPKGAKACFRINPDAAWTTCLRKK